MNNADRHNLTTMLANYRAHLKEDHSREDYGNDVARFHHREFPHCTEVPRYSDYRFMGPICLDR